MFFVGITGQLITLILTVGLPVIILFNSHRTIESQHSLQIIKHFRVEQTIVSSCLDSSDNLNFGNSFLKERERTERKISASSATLPVIKEVKYKPVFFENLENKAPPSLSNIFC
ncbi:MAG: hypothetical protein J7L95_06415 [Prolixibacteraceae bacterium]|nr:hypothetical protein [Prolixibacteraceae bacterium]